LTVKYTWVYFMDLKKAIYDTSFSQFDIINFVFVICNYVDDVHLIFRKFEKIFLLECRNLLIQMLTFIRFFCNGFS
jgi:hypothetical protein